MRRMPPANVEDNLAGLIDLVPDLMEQLLSAVDQPLRIESGGGRDYLLCDYNRDGDSYRSPWSNEYYPPLDYKGTSPSAKLREFEIQANNVFDVYRDLYYEGGVSSVYAWDLAGGFACVVLIKKTADGTGKRDAKGSWDSIHVVEVVESGTNAKYKLTSTVMLSLITSLPTCGDVVLSGSMTRLAQAEYDTAQQDLANPHLVNIGKLIEDTESKMRNQLEQIYFLKTKDIMAGELRVMRGMAEVNRSKQLAQEAMREMSAR